MVHQPIFKTGVQGIVIGLKQGDAVGKMLQAQVMDKLVGQFKVPGIIQLNQEFKGVKKSD